MHKAIFLQQLQDILHDYQEDQQHSNAVLQAQKNQLQGALETWMSEAPTTAHPTNPLAREVRYVHKKLQQCFRRWDKALADQQNMQQIVLEYPQHLIFLIYGKVNSGKTSLCNWLMDEFSEQKQRCFYLGRGEVIECEAPFQASYLDDEPRIQGVEIAERIVLIDAPGLYSTNLHQADLAKAVIAHSDAVLWLTPSHAPGQADELKDLIALLQQDKPILPIISCSDVFEEDIDPQTQDLKSIYRNKTQQERTLQQQELLLRLQHATAAHIAPISISLKMYHENKNSKDSGLDDLMGQLCQLVEQASFYKLQKQQRNIRHFIQQRILGDLTRLLNKGQQKLARSFEEQQQDLQARIQHLQLLLSDELEVKIARLVQEYQHEANRDSVVQEAEQYLNQILNQQLPQQFNLFFNQFAQQHIELDAALLPAYVEQYIEVPQQHGQARILLTTATLAAVAGFTGFCLPGFLNLVPKDDQGWNFLTASLSSGVATWLTATKFKYSRLTVSIVQEKVSADGSELTTALQAQMQDRLQAHLQQLEHSMLANLALYPEYYQSLAMLLKRVQQEDEQCRVI